MLNQLHSLLSSRPSHGSQLTQRKSPKPRAWPTRLPSPYLLFTSYWPPFCPSEAKHTPTPGALHVLFHMSGMLFLMFVCLTSSRQHDSCHLSSHQRAFLAILPYHSTQYPFSLPLFCFSTWHSWPPHVDYNYSFTCVLH